MLIPTGATALEPGDRLVVFGAAQPELAGAVRRWVAEGAGLSAAG